MKVIRINTPKGHYDLPLQLIAEDRATAYENQAKNPKRYQEEIDYIMEDDFEGIDWLINNHDWVDWVEKATKVNSKVETTDEDFWTGSSDFIILDV